MRLAYCVGAVLTSAAFSACTSVSPQLQPVTGDLAKTQHFYGLFDITPPQSEGWYLVQNGRGELAYGKPKNVAQDSYVLSSSAARTDRKFASATDFLEFAKIARANDNDPRRFEMLSYSENISKARHEICTEFHFKAKDKRISKQGRDVFMEAKGLSCVHPQAPILVTVQYSERSDSPFQNQDFISEGETFLSSLVIHGGPVWAAKDQ